MTSLGTLASQWINFVPAPRPKYVGVYFLIDRDVVVYVGQSLDIELRLTAHVSRLTHPVRRWRVKFDRVAWIPVAPLEQPAFESAFIRLLAPRYNVKTSPDDSRDAEIAARYGLLGPDPKHLADFERRRRKSYPKKAQRGFRRVVVGDQRARSRRLFAAIGDLFAAQVTA